VLASFMLEALLMVVVPYFELLLCTAVIDLFRTVSRYKSCFADYGAFTVLLLLFYHNQKKDSKIVVLQHC